MLLLLRPLARLAAFVLLGALALGGLAVAVACVPSDGWETAATWLGLASAPRRAAEAEAGAAVWVCAAVAAGALLVAAGALLPYRSRLLALRGGPVLARRRALRDAAEALVTRGLASRARVRLRRRRLVVDAAFPPGADVRSGTVAIERALHELAGAFGLRVSVRARLGEKGARVR
jgi:hypothetical protein